MIITPGQACFLYGWWKAKKTLLWEDVIQNPDIDAAKILQANLTWDHMYKLQPDIRQWIRYKKVSKSDIFNIATRWECDIVKDFNLDIGDLTDPRFTVEMLLKMGIDYHYLCEMGLTGENMRLFTHITLIGWSQLGFTRKDAEKIAESHLYYCFGMRKTDVIASLKSTS